MRFRIQTLTNHITVFITPYSKYVNKRISVFCKSFCYSDVCGSPVITPYITFVNSSVFEIGCVSRVKTRVQQPFVVLSVTFPHRGIL